MKKTILALTITAAISLPVVAAPMQVDRQLADQHTHQLIETQMTDIDASALAKLNAQSNNVAVVDDVIYEKQSDGTWAAVGAASAALFAGLLSSSSSSSNGNDLPGMELPIEHSPSRLPSVDQSNPIQDPYSISETRSGWLVTDNETGSNAFVDRNGDIRDTHTGEVIATSTLYKGTYYISNTDGITVATYNKSTGLVFTGVDQDIDRGIGGPIEHPIQDAYSISETASGWVVTDNETGSNAFVDRNGDIRDTHTGEVIATSTLYKGTYYISNTDGTTVATYNKSTGLVFTGVDQDIDRGITPPVMNPDHTNPDFEFVTDGNGTIGIVRDGLLLGSIEGSVNVNTRHLEVGPNGGVWYNNPQAPAPIRLPFKVETSITGHLVVTDSRTGEIVGIGGQIGGDMAPIKLTIVKSDLGWTIFGSQGRSITISNVELEGRNPTPDRPINIEPETPDHTNPEWELRQATQEGVYDIYRDGVDMGTVRKESSEDGRTNMTIVSGNAGGIVIFDHANRDVQANAQAKETIKSIAQQPRFDQLRSKVQARIN